ncbi:MAG: ABC transporter permease [Polyangiaceae bacterium]|nr:ABC transporter permease [Polyangiaceae bacterium]
MLQRIATIALNSYREAARARILYGLVGVALVTALYSVVVGAYSLRSAPRVVSDLGASSLSLFSIIVAIVLAATSLHRELEYKTIFPILARPVRRSEYIVGKCLGNLLTLSVFIAIHGFVVLLTLAAMGGRSTAVVLGVGIGSVVVLAILVYKVKRLGTFAPIPWAFAMLVAAAFLASVYPDERRVVLAMCLLTLFEVAIVTGIATVFASFSSPFLTALLTLGLFAVGRQADALAKLPAKVFGQFIHDAGVVLSKIVPNLHVYVPARPLLTGEAMDAPLGPYLLMAGLQSFGWAVGLLVVSVLIFQKRDFL